MVPVFLIVLASSILLTFGIATIMLRCHCQKKYPGNDNNQQPPALQNKLEDKRTVVSIERGAIPNCDLPPSCACATPEISCGSESNQSVAAYNEAPVSICKDNHKLYILEADNIPNDARNSTLIPGSCQDQSPKHASSPCELKSSKEAPKEFNDSMIKSVIIEESSICTPSRDPHQYNSYERICIYEKIQHCDINLSSTAEIYTTPLSSAAAEKETTESASKYYNQSNSGYERVWGYEVIQHCDLKLEDLQKL